MLFYNNNYYYIIIYYYILCLDLGIAFQVGDQNMKRI